MADFRLIMVVMGVIKREKVYKCTNKDYFTYKAKPSNGNGSYKGVIKREAVY